MDAWMMKAVSERTQRVTGIALPSKIKGIVVSHGRKFRKDEVVKNDEGPKAEVHLRIFILTGMEISPSRSALTDRFSGC